LAWSERRKRTWSNGMLLNLNEIFDPDRPPPGKPEPTPMALEGPGIDSAADLPAEWHYAWDERAAIMEFDGNLPRERAEALALADIRALMSNVSGTRRSKSAGGGK